MTAPEETAPNEAVPNEAAPGLLFLQPLPLAHCRDVEGRPLLEGKAPPELLGNVPLELVECRYAGSRYRHAKPMNLSAWQQMARHWPGIVGGLGWLRRLYVGQRPPDGVRLLEFWQIAKAGALLPAFLTYRADAPTASSALPVVAAGLYKVSLGLFNTVQNMVLAGLFHGDVTPRTLVNPAAVLAYAEAQQMFIGAAEVCGGPPQGVRETILAIAEGSPRPTSLGELLPAPAPARLLAFAAQAQLLDLLNFAFPLLTYPLLGPVWEAAQRGAGWPPDLAARLLKLEATFPSEARTLAQAGPEVWRWLSESLTALFDELDASGRSAALVRQMRQPEALAVRRVQVALAHSLGNSAAASNWPLGGETVLHSLAQFLVAERARLALHTELQNAANAALARAPYAAALTGAELSAAVGPTVRDVLAETTGLEISNTAQATDIRKGRVSELCQP